MHDYFYLNGELVLSQSCSLLTSDRSYLLGDGLFETILVKNSKPIYHVEHLERLQASCIEFAYNPLSVEELSKAILSVIEANSLEEGSIRLTVSPRESDGLLAVPRSALNILITFRRGVPYAPALYERGFTAITAKSTRRNQHSPLSRHKTTSFLDNIVAKREARALNADEAILLNTAGNIAEGSVTNVFLVIHGEVLTPPIADGALPGIIRQKVLQSCNSQCIPYREASLAPIDLILADEVFLTNSLMGIMPLSKVEHYSFDLNKAPIVSELAKIFNAN